MKSRKEVQRIAKKLFVATMTNRGVDVGVAKQIIAKFSQLKPRGYQALLDAYMRLIRLEVQENRAIVESFASLDEPVKGQITADLRKKYGAQISPEFTTNQALLGGMKVRIGSDVWDGSIKNRLERLSEKFS